MVEDVIKIIELAAGGVACVQRVGGAVGSIEFRRIAAEQLGHGRCRIRGCLFLGYLLSATQKKVASRRSATGKERADYGAAARQNFGLPPAKKERAKPAQTLR